MAAIDLSKLSSPTRRLVQDAPNRASLTSALLRSDPSSSEATLARDAIDAAVVEILEVAGLPRGRINGPVIEHVGRTWFGRKAPDCTLSIDIEAFSMLPEHERPDSLVRTWIHESLHARQPFATGYAGEYREAQGYEEGVIEGLSRLIVLGGLGLQPVIASYGYYVASYRALSTVLDVDAEFLWRMLWTFPAGSIGAGLVPTIEHILQQRRRLLLSPIQRARIALFGARHFATGRSNEQPNGDVLVSNWRSVIP